MRQLLNLSIFILLLFTATYQDSFLSNAIGEIGRSPTILLLPILIGYSFNKRQKLNTTAFKSIDKVLRHFLLTYTIVSIINLFLWFSVGEQTLIYLNQNVIYKCIKYGMYYIVFILIYQYSYHSFSFATSNKSISIGLLALIIFHVVIIITELCTIPKALTWFHANDIYYPRIRMLTYESSWTGGIAVLLFCGGMAFSEKRISQIICLVFILLFTVTSGSKQFLMVFPISMFLASFKIEHKNKNLLLFVSLVGFIIAVILLTPVLIDKFTEDLVEFSSTVTRSSVFLNSFRIILFVQPIGTGGLYFYYVATELQKTAQIIVDLIGFGVLDEVQRVGKESDEFITAGSTFAEWTLLGGYLGIILYLMLLVRLYRYAKINYWLLVGFIHFAITNTFSETMVTKVNWAVFFALVCIYYDRKARGNFSNIS